MDVTAVGDETPLNLDRPLFRRWCICHPGHVEQELALRSIDIDRLEAHRSQTALDDFGAADELEQCIGSSVVALHHRQREQLGNRAGYAAVWMVSLERAARPDVRGSEPHHAIERQLPFGNLIQDFDCNRQLHDARHRKAFVPSNFQGHARFQMNQRGPDSSPCSLGDSFERGLER